MCPVESTEMPDATKLLETESVRALLECLSAENEHARIVGGAIRNALMARDIADIDIATTCLPQTVIERARKAGWKPVPTGLAHGTITVVIEGRPFEVTTLREDVDTDGRHAIVAFGRDFQADAARRDFTMNALSMGLDGEIHDYFSGRADIGACRVRFIGNAGQRLREDFLRGLRFLRFSAGYGEGRLDPAGFAAVVEHRDGLHTLSRERVRQELLKLLVAECALPVIEAAEAEGLLSEALGFALDTQSFARTLGLARNEGVELDAITRFAALAGEHAGDSAVIWQERLRLSNAEIKLLHRLNAATCIGKASPRLLRYRFGNEALPALILRTAANIDPLHELPERLADARKPSPEFRLSGADIVAAGIPAGPKVGELLAMLEARWIEAGLPDAIEAQQALLQGVLIKSVL